MRRRSRWTEGDAQHLLIEFELILNLLDVLAQLLNLAVEILYLSVVAAW